MGAYYFEVLSKRCDECLFSKNRIVDLERMRQVLEECRLHGKYFICHKSTLAGGTACCRGFYDSQTTNSMVQIAQRLNVVKFVEVPEESS